MSFKQICQLGFNCPYYRINEDGEICVYPYIRITDKELGLTFGFIEESDCPLMNYDSILEDWRINLGGKE